MRSWPLLAAAFLGCVASAAPSSAQVGSVSTPASPASAAAPRLWTLPASKTGLRVTGETGSLTWPLYVPASADGGMKRLQIAYQASIAVMPEASWITAAINGQTIGRLPIASPTGIKTVPLDVPPGVLQPGWNAISINVSQRHRVDCTIASTYELWTQIDPSRTGFVGGPPPIASLADLPALSTDDAGATRIHLLLPKDPTPPDLGRAVRAIEHLALRGHFDHPVIDTAPGSSGLEVAVGSASFLANVAGASVKPGQGTVLTRTADGTPLLTVTGSTDAEIDAAIESLNAAGTAAVGTEEGLKALATSSGVRLKPGGSLTLADLGIATRTFSGRLYREGFDVLLPPDAYPADYGEARLSIDGGYAAGLTRDAHLIVRVNGIVDGVLDLDRAGGAVLQNRIIHMPLDPFRPGRNRIELEAQLPAQSDQACDALTSIGAKERLLLLGTSTLSLPPLARVAQFPGLSATLAGNLRVTPTQPPRLYIPRATDGVVAAAATLLANTSVKVGAPTGAVFLRGTPQSGMEPAVVIGNASDLPQSLMQSVGLDPQSIATAWRGGLRPGAVPGAPDAGRPDRDVSDSARLDAWGDRVESNTHRYGSTGVALNAISDRFLDSLRSAGLVSYGERSLAVTGDTSFVVAQGLADETPLTLITARDDKALATGAAAFTEPGRLSSLDGRAASLEDGAQGATLVSARDTAFFRTEPFSFVNDRLIAAGWVSKHAAWYIGAVFLATVLLGSSTWAFLHYGRRGQAG